MMKRILVFALLGPLIAGVLISLREILLPIGTLAAVLLVNTIFATVFGFVPALLAGFVDIVLARTNIDRLRRIALTAVAAAVIAGGLLQIKAIYDVSLSGHGFLAVGIIAAVAAAICSWLCSRNEALAGGGPAAGPAAARG